jgi:hypothetical protein
MRLLEAVVRLRERSMPLVLRMFYQAIRSFNQGVVRSSRTGRTNKNNGLDISRLGHFALWRISSHLLVTFPVVLAPVSATMPDA